MQTAPTIRFVVPSDYEAWLPLWEGYNHFYGRSGPTALSPEITQTTWSRFLDDQEPMYAMVAELHGQPVGMVQYLFHRSTNMLANTCYLQDLFTQESCRGKGIAKALIEAVYEQAKQMGSPRVYWQTHETNLTAMKLYDRVAERSGFLVYRKPL